MKKALGLITISSLTLFAATGVAADNTIVAISKKATPTKQHPIKYMFVVSAGSGEIKKGSQKGESILEMKIPSIDQVLVFSDRPNRIVKYIPASTLQQIWPVGSNSFKSDPPNAVLSSVNIKPMIIELKGVEISGSKLSFRFNVAAGMQPQVAALEKVVLSIDGTNTFMGVCNDTN